MKRLIKIVSLLLLFVGVSMGCSKFLDLDPPYTQDAENFSIMKTNILGH
ncbi:MAG: hypothetical protein CM15mP65_06110 [Crocinitomicaceae bacterium]|nr:MAG: hypothetical protein CM15mP65_06110 [Crocinitomicaceae bacterium]